VFERHKCDAGPEKSGLTWSQFKSIEEYVENLEYGSPSVSALAALCQLSESHFCRLFRAETGESVGRYLRSVQIRRARNLLLETDLPLKEIAFRLGFSSPGNFSAAFRAAVDCPPGTFRFESKRARNQPADYQSTDPSRQPLLFQSLMVG